MLDVDTFLTTLYVTVDDFCQSLPPKRKPGPDASLCASEVITLSLFARWSRFSSERDFYRYAQNNLKDAFPLGLTCFHGSSENLMNRVQALARVAK